MIEILAAAPPGGEIPTSGSWTLLITFFCLSIFVSFACSIFEAVLLSVTQPYVANLKKTKAEAGARLQKLKDHIDAPLTSILTLNTVAHTVGAIGVGNQAGGVAAQHFPESVSLFVNIVTAITTVAVLILSEIIPKTVGATHWRKLAPAVGLMLEKLTWAMTPVVWLNRLFGKGGHGKAEFSREELEVMAEMGRKAGKLREDESRILTNLLQLPREQGPRRDDAAGGGVLPAAGDLRGGVHGKPFRHPRSRGSPFTTRITTMSSDSP